MTTPQAKRAAALKTMETYDGQFEKWPITEVDEAILIQGYDRGE